MLNFLGTGLVLIDLQKGFSDPKWGKRNNILLEKNISELLALYRKHTLSVIHVRHDSMEAGSPLRAGGRGFAFIDEMLPAQGEEVITKRRHSAFVGTALERSLRRREIREPVFVGLTTDHCVSTSVRMAHDLGFEPIVVSDATATFGRRTPYGNEAGADLMHEIALASLDKEFGDVVTAAQLMQGLNQLTLATERSEMVALKNLS